MKQTLRSACIVLLLSSSFVAFNGCGNGNNSTTGADSSTSTTTTDTTGSMNRMADSTTGNDTGGRGTQLPPPIPNTQNTPPK